MSQQLLFLQPTPSSGNLTIPSSSGGSRSISSRSGFLQRAENALHGMYSDDLLCVVVFGIMANVIIAAACVTTLAFVRRRSSSCTKLEGSCAANKKRHDSEECLSSESSDPAAVSPDVYRVLAPAFATTYYYPTPVSVPQGGSGSSRINNNASKIPEVYGSKNLDVQAMLLSSANMSQFFGPLGHKDSSSLSSLLGKKQCGMSSQTIQWEMA